MGGGTVPTLTVKPYLVARRVARICLAAFLLTHRNVPGHDTMAQQAYPSFFSTLEYKPWAEIDD